MTATAPTHTRTLRLYGVRLGTLQAGLLVDHDGIVRLAGYPLRWTKGKPLAVVAALVMQGGGCVERITGGPE